MQKIQFNSNSYGLNIRSSLGLKAIQVLTLMFSLMLAGCSGFYDVNPYSVVKDADFNKNRDDLNASAMGMYQPLTQEVHKFLLWGDARADMVTTGQSEPDPYINEFVLNSISKQNPYTNYGGLYKTITRCNQQLEKVYKVAELDDKILPRDAAAFYAEALLLRAYSYFILAKSFEEFPIILSDYAEKVTYVSESGDTVYRKAQSLSNAEIRGSFYYMRNREDVLRMIYSDVLTGLGILPINFEWNRNSLPAQERYGRISQPMAATFAAELALWLGNYQAASAFANSPVRNSNHTLGSSGTWINQFTGSYASLHSLFLLGYNYNNSFEGNRLQEFTSPIAKDGGKYYLKPASHVIQNIFSYEGGDIRTVFSYKIINGDTAIWKYIGADNVASMRPAYQSDASWQFYRSADAFIIKALADLMLDDYSTAFNFVNMLRVARGLTALDPTQTDYRNKEFMLDLIFKEKARENAFEGKRWYDLMLWSRLSRQNQLAEAVAAKYGYPKSEEVKARLQNEENWYIPIDPVLW
ncbi:RagB/SusD family nutrient uptake outer membrane protein [Niabella ginsengisoli]|uniref:RagB/SusD family nutrient uptake outer membrane protein n=1 Tax=Niabella ginsengisoli TaxID=522298 RepID=A0ABS9SN62_9BACT|nr:RagB/SusD family nutrient uptake outer membrane protein [Niabella ginsengisoli]MCH5599821.1 RagB/SusD family nutrient uptake outer membrane protein [Niabella ginsengisoli]